MKTRLVGRLKQEGLLVVAIGWLLVHFACQFMGTRWPHLRVPPGLTLLDSLPFCALWAALRVCMHHPFYLPDYRRWLETTPWTRGKPLPLGEVDISPFDLVALAIFTIPALFPAPPPMRVLMGLGLLSPLIIFVFIYLTFLIVPFARTGVRNHAYAITFGLGLACLLGRTPTLFALVLIVLYAIGVHGLRREMDLFPWDPPKRGFNGPLIWDDDPEDPAPSPHSKVGWPFNRLSPVNGTARIVERRDAVLLSIVVGWWVFVALALRNKPIDPVGSFVLGSCVYAGLWGLRKFIYCNGHVPLLKPARGRPGILATLVSPAIGVLVFPLGRLALVKGLGLPVLSVFPLTVTCALLWLLNVGPSLRVWRLTGHQRVCGALSGKGKEYVVA